LYYYAVSFTAGITVTSHTHTSNPLSISLEASSGSSPASLFDEHSLVQDRWDKSRADHASSEF
jgi:hypothetical protein